jgi:hypothetical protein
MKISRSKGTSESDRLLSDGTIEATVVGFVEAFLRDSGDEALSPITILFEPQNLIHGNTTSKPMDPLTIRLEGDRVICTLKLADLTGVPQLALQGMVDMVLAKAIMERDSQRYHLNFSRQILPLFPVSGSGVNFIRYIVECLSKGLKQYIATKSLISIGHGPPQAHLLFFKMDFPREDVSTCQMVAPHSWTKAVFLCRRIETYMALRALSSHGVAFSIQLQEAWEQGHEYLTGEDRAFLNKLVSILEQSAESSFSELMVQLFLVVRDRYLHRRLD